MATSSHRFQTRIGTIVAAAMVLSFAGATLALGVVGIPGADKLIHACYQNMSGTLRAVPVGTACSTQETALAWPTQAYVDGLVATEAAARSVAVAAEAAARLQGDANTIAAAKLYTDQQIAGNATATTTYIDQHDATTLAAAQQYTNSQVAANASTVYSKRIDYFEVVDSDEPIAVIAQVTLPPGIYVVMASLLFGNTADLTAQDNSRVAFCELGVYTTSHTFLGGFGGREYIASMTMQFAYSSEFPQTHELRCKELYGGTDRSYVSGQGYLIAISANNYVAIP